jgi:hypothetical protein
MPDKNFEKNELKAVLFYILLTKESIQSGLEHSLDKNNDDNDKIDKLDELILSLKKGSLDRKLWDWFQNNMPRLHSFLNNKDSIRKLLF